MEPLNDSCPTCGGSGAAPDGEPCEWCDGVGRDADAPSRIEPLNDSVAGPYDVDVTVTLASGGTVRVTGHLLNWRGVREVLEIMKSAVPDAE